MASGRRKGSRENGAFFPGEKINGKLPLILDCSREEKERGVFISADGKALLDGECSENNYAWLLKSRSKKSRSRVVRESLLGGNIRLRCRGVVVGRVPAWHQRRHS